MRTVLLTGGSGLLGQRVIPHLLSHGAQLRLISRRPGREMPSVTWIQGDLRDPVACQQALDGADTLLHLATQPLKAGADLAVADTLFPALCRSGVQHVAYMSITGLERMQGAAYYREKLEIEQRLKGSGVPFTIQRSTQFHEFVAQLLQQLTLGPVTLVPAGVILQPVGAQVVAQRLAQLTLGEPAGRVPDLAGPDAASLTTLARQRPGRAGQNAVIPLPLPIPLFRAWQGRAAVASDAEVVGEGWASWLTASQRETTGATSA
ncbi:SDR family oxidoreductase [Deinococcus hopiensis]|uniref:Uncharacterized conserved protein YbjT, contains NAD(P)-binding and DUF2867 domains n=1 Tax=Deinococcus hopiensis KR-140 TaxID=695939 RepID=A0A1W1VUF2_9DEIO|nr:NAD(P)H-binding protein [Deinococcus hopiensis]SMB97012.1 Uncharacterized conserved protein YbjT, contains NAD(P)-binding and DUF2867 domains [Deinococcus hopiensis KR-140]